MIVPLDTIRQWAYAPLVPSPPKTPSPGGTAVVKQGKTYRRSAAGPEHTRRLAFGREWGAFASQVSQELRGEKKR